MAPVLRRVFGRLLARAGWVVVRADPRDRQALADLSEGVWCEAGIEDVRANLWITGYPRGKIHFVTGKVEDTIPGAIADHIALLRLDTDWYESTQHETRHLYPRLSGNGTLIIDDHGHWQGARKAIDEYFAASDAPVFLHRVDDTARLMVKHGSA